MISKKAISAILCICLVASLFGGLTVQVNSEEPANELSMITGIDFEENSDCIYYGPALVNDGSCFNSSISQSGRSLEFNITGGNQLEGNFDSSKVSEYADPQALVFWLNIPTYANPTGDLVNLDIGLICGNSRWNLNQSPTAGMEITYISDSDKSVTKIPLKSLGGSVNLDAPSSFTGWVVIPMSLLSNNAWHTEETVKDLSVAPKLSFLSNWTPINDIGKKLYIDTVGFTKNINDFFTSLGAVIVDDLPVEENPYWALGIDFEEDSDSNFAQGGIYITDKAGFFSNEYSQEGRAIKAIAKSGFQTISFFDKSKETEYTKGIALAFWLKTPVYDNPSSENIANLNIGITCGDTRWRLNTMPSSGMNVTFVSTKDQSTTQVALKSLDGGVFLDAPSDFEGWVIAPFGILSKDWGPATEIKLDKVSEFIIVFEWMPIEDQNKTYCLDSVGLIKDMDGFMENVAKADTTNDDTDKRYFTIARDFETSNEYLNVINGTNDYTFGVSPYGRAVSFAPNDVTAGPMLEASIAKNKAKYAGAKALVFWIKTPDTDEQHKFRLGVDDRKNSEKKEFYQLPNEISIGQFIFKDGKIEDTIISDNQMIVPKNFEGWVVIPLNILEQHTSYAIDDGILDIEYSEIFQLWYDGNTRKGPYYIDEIGFTTDSRKFMESVGGVVLSENSKIANDFENGSISNTDVASATVINDKSDITQLSLTDEISATGYALKLISSEQGASAKIKNLIVDKNATKESTALAFWLSVPWYDNSKLKMTLMLDDGTKQVNGGNEMYSLSTSSNLSNSYVYYVDDSTGISKKAIIKDNCIELERGFYGYIVVPLSNFIYDTQYNSNKDDGVLDVSKNTFLRVIMQTGTEDLPLYIDDVSFVKDTATYIEDELKGILDDSVIMSNNENIKIKDGKITIASQMTVKQFIDLLVIDQGYSIKLCDKDNNEITDTSMNAMNIANLEVYFNSELYRIYMVLSANSEQESDNTNPDTSGGMNYFNVLVMLLSALAIVVVFKRKTKAIVTATTL